MNRMLKALAITASLVGLMAGAAEARDQVKFGEDVPSGTILIKTKERRLYFVNGDGTATRYTVAVGKPGKQWEGHASISRKVRRPDWAPPQEVKNDNPAIPDLIKGGAPNNPMGEAALVLSKDEYAIHGTNVPKSIGRFASYGCIRMLNDDILDLFEKVDVGTTVMVTR
jgi:lipoprotein-anchoring transpeptidase ErfK/SrfK